MRVTVKEGKSVFIYGKLFLQYEEITLKPVESSKFDLEGNPIIIPVKQQYSPTNMLTKEAIVERERPKEPHEMDYAALKAECKAREIEIPQHAKKDQLIQLLLE